MVRCRIVLLPLASILLLGACSGAASLDPRRWFSRDDAAAPASREAPGVESRLRSVNSSAGATVRARESGDLLVVLITLDNVPPGPYRVVFHDNPNCSSPNGFSAGVPWSPPGAKDPPARLLPEVMANSQGSANVTARLRGVRLGGAGGLLNRSVLVYQGLATPPLQPGVPNNVIACGTFSAATSLF